MRVIVCARGDERRRMPLSEPIPTAFLVTTFGVLLIISVACSRLLERMGVPILLFFLGLGMLAGSEGIGGVHFEDYHFAFRVGTVALILILFDGGLNTRWSMVRAGIATASILATAGVFLTALIVALAARLFGLPWDLAFLLGAVVSSTDAAAVFSVLRGSGLNLEKRVGVTLELESGLNDPMAVMLTIAFTQVALAGEGWLAPELLWQIPLQLVIGAAVGLIIGWLSLVLLRRVRVRAGGLFPVLTLGLALLSFGAATLAQGSGFLAVYTTALVVGNGAIPYGSGLRRIHDAIAWLGQISMFLLLGLLVFPSRLLEVFWIGMGIALILAFIARPVSVLLCLLPFRFPWKQSVYVSWVGLRGAVPIILATIPILEEVPQATRIFDIVFFIVVVNALLPGATLRWATAKLGLQTPEQPQPAAVLDINATQLLNGEVSCYYVEPHHRVAGQEIRSLGLPEATTIILIVRGRDLIAPRGLTAIQPGDHVYVFNDNADRERVRDLFRRLKEESTVPISAEKDAVMETPSPDPPDTAQ